MSLIDLLQKLSNEKYIVLTESELSEILISFTLVEEKDTMFSDFIRILKSENRYYIQETTMKGEILLRQCESLSLAQEFVHKRITIYDKMWDGCGCKVNYYD